MNKIHLQRQLFSTFSDEDIQDDKTEEITQIADSILMPDGPETGVNFAIRAVQENGLWLQRMAKDYRKNIEIVYIAAQNNLVALSYAHRSLVTLKPDDLIQLMYDIGHRCSAGDIREGFVRLGLYHLVHKSVDEFQLTLKLIALTLIKAHHKIYVFQNNTKITDFVDEIKVQKRYEESTHPVAELKAIYTDDEFACYIEKLKILYNETSSVAVSLSHNEYTIGMSYDPETGFWLLIDLLNPNDIKIESDMELQDLIFERFSRRDKQTIQIDTIFYTTAENRPSLESYLITWAQDSHVLIGTVIS